MIYKYQKFYVSKGGERWGGVSQYADTKVVRRRRGRQSDFTNDIL